MIIPKIGDFIKHKEFLDVCIQVSKKPYVYPDGSALKVRGWYWNMGFRDAYNIGHRAKFIIEPSDWLICTHDADNLRQSSWVPLIKEG